MEANSRDYEGWSLELFVETPWSSYIQQMIKGGTFGDALALRAVENLSTSNNCCFDTWGRCYGNNVTCKYAPLTRFTIGHFTQGEGDH